LISFFLFFFFFFFFFFRKATVVITSPYEGRITRLYYKAGDVAKTGLPLIDVLIAGDAPGNAAPAKSAAAPANSASSPSAATLTGETGSRGVASGKVKASPAVRRLARQQNLDLAQVVASGRDGRVLKGDILHHVSGASSQPSVKPTTSSAPPPLAAASATASPPPAAVSPPLFAPRGAQPDRRETLKGVRKAMVKSMTPAAAVPWFGYSDEIEMDGLMAARSLLRKDLESKGIKLTYMPFLLKAFASALQDFPILNSSLTPDLNELVYRGNINLGVAMDTPNGLVVPNIKHVSERSVLEIGVELQRLQTLALAGKLGVEDLTGGTFTLSNIGQTFFFVCVSFVD
jgi:2-oxoisovalerate dehydrogenase E2 component (dihydrolipoyl transacylase)